jgi:hypothetical protein
MDTKYSERKVKVFDTHWGGGYTEVYDVDEYRAVVTYTTGSSVAIYKKDDLPIDKVNPGWRDMLWNYIPTKSLSSGWWYCDETVDEAIDRNIDQIIHPDQRVWYEKIHREDNDGKWRIGNQRICYEHGITEERKKEIESRPDFAGWYEEPQWYKDLQAKYGPK